MMIDDDWFYQILYQYSKVLIKANAHKNVKIWYDSKKQFLVGTGHVKRKDLVRFCVLHTAGLKIVSGFSDMLWLQKSEVAKIKLDNLLGIASY